MKKVTWKEILTSHSNLSGAFDNNSQTLTTYTSGPKITTAVCLWVVWQCEWRWCEWVCVFDLTVVFRCLGISYHLCCWCCCFPAHTQPPSSCGMVGLTGDERKERSVFVFLSLLYLLYSSPCEGLAKVVTISVGILGHNGCQNRVLFSLLVVVLLIQLKCS